jgi:hypothetical protein
VRSYPFIDQLGRAAGFARDDAPTARLELPPQAVEFDKPIDRSQQVPFWHMPFERELVEQRVLLNFPLPHHRLPPDGRDSRKSRNYKQKPCPFSTVSSHTRHSLPPIRVVSGKREAAIPSSGDADRI